MTRVLALNVHHFKTMQLLLVSAAFFILFSLAMPAPAQAAVTDAQITSVKDLLVSYGVDEKTIKKIEHELRKEQKESKPTLKVGEVSKEEVSGKYKDMLADTILRFVNAFTGTRLESPKVTISTGGDGSFSLPLSTSTVPAGRYTVQAFSSSTPTVAYATSRPFVIKEKKTATSTSSVIKPPTCLLRADEDRVRSGEKVVLYWASKNATTASKTGIFNVERGYTVVSPTQTTIYEKTFTGPGGSITCSITVEIKDQDEDTPKATEIVQQGQSSLAKAIASVGDGLASAVVAYYSFFGVDF